MKIIVNTKYKDLLPFLEELNESFEKEGEMIYNERNQLKRYKLNGYDIIVKRFKVPHLLNRFVYSFFRPSKAKRSYEYALRLNEMWVPSPTPIAYLEEKRQGLLYRSYFVSVFESEFDHIRSYMYGEIEDDDFVKALADFIADFHKKGILHLDLSPGNILFKKEGDEFSFRLIDINRMKFKNKLSLRERFRSFKRLTDNSKIIEGLADEYAEKSNLNTNDCREKIKKECGLFFKTLIE